MMLSSFQAAGECLGALARADRGEESLTRRIRYRKQDLVPWSPVTEAYADGEGLTLAQLCHATITTSDNTAGNLILASYGGPQALTQYARQLGDKITRLDRNEPDLNTRVEGGSLIRLTASHGHDHEQAPLGRCTLTLIAEFAPPVAARNTTGESASRPEPC